MIEPSSADEFGRTFRDRTTKARSSSVYAKAASLFLGTQLIGISTQIAVKVNASPLAAEAFEGVISVLSLRQRGLRANYTKLELNASPAPN